MWVHRNLVDDDQWDATKKNPTVGKGRMRSSNVISFILEHNPNSIVILDDSIYNQIVYQVAAVVTDQLMVTPSGQPYLPQYKDTITTTFVGASVKQSYVPHRTETLFTTQDKGKQKEVCFNKDLMKTSPKLNDPFTFDSVTKLANI